MQDLRELIQSKFNEISVLESGPPIPDSVVEEGKTYFGYELSEDFLDSDMDSNYVMQVSIIGRVVRKNSTSENTLEIIDKALEELKKKLKELKIRYSYKDITMDNNIRKILVTANVKYNELLKK